MFCAVTCTEAYEEAPFWLHAIISLNGINQLIFVMVKYGVLFEVRTNLSITNTSVGFKGLSSST
jgi:hypothetical protein